MSTVNKELFNQPLKSTVAASDRIAVGIPSQEGADNILFPNFINSFAQREKSKALAIGANRVDFPQAFSSANYVLIVQDNNGIGFQITAQDASGFNIETLGNTAINYIAILA